MLLKQEFQQRGIVQWEGLLIAEEQTAYEVMCHVQFPLPDHVASASFNRGFLLWGRRGERTLTPAHCCLTCTVSQAVGDCRGFPW